MTLREISFARRCKDLICEETCIQYVSCERSLVSLPSKAAGSSRRAFRLASIKFSSKERFADCGIRMWTGVMKKHIEIKVDKNKTIVIYSSYPWDYDST